MELNCDVIRDLLPSYADSLVNGTTKDCVEAHLTHCPHCRAYLEQLENKEKIVLPSAKDVQSRLKKASQRTTMRRILPALTAALLLLTLLAGWLICAWVPVWISYEDAVISAEQVNSFAFRVYTDPDVYGCYGLVERVDGNSVEAVSFYGYRNGLFYDEPYIQDGFAGFHADNEVWFYGGFTGEEDVLLNGGGVSTAQSVIQTNRDKHMDRMYNESLQYVCWGSLLVGVLCVCCGILLRKKGVGRGLLLTAVPFLSCWLACLFVTNGHLTCSIEWASVIDMGYLRRYVSIIGMTLLLWMTTWSAWALIKVKKRKC